MGFKINIVEDNKDLGELLQTYLSREGWQVRLFNLGNEAIAAIPERPHLWVLDIMLPDTDGFDVIKKIKEKTPEIPVIFISARDQTLDRVLGLEMGSDDYIAKPFLPRELVIRVKRLFDRVYSDTAQKKGKIYIFDDYEIDADRRSVTDNQEILGLTSKETDLVLAFCANAGKPITRDYLLNSIWDENYFGSDRVVDDLVRRVRKKMPRLRIETVYGQGYRLIV